MKTPIRRALVPGSRLHDLVKDGVQALEQSYRMFLSEGIRASFDDSLDLDKALQSGHEQENRWDYLLGHQPSGQVLGLEPHTANNHEIAVVIKKRKAAIDQLRDHLKPGTHVARWFWVASGKTDFLPFEKASLRLADNGIAFVGKTLLDKHLPPAPTPRPPKTRGR